MRIVPVIDLCGGAVVHGMAGRRTEYQPIQSRLAAGASPVAIGRAFSRLGFRRIYIADLDALAGLEPAWADYQAIAESGAALWIDAGLRNAEEASRLANRDSESRPSAIVAGLESLSDIGSLAEIVRILGPERLIFSLDLNAGVPLTDAGSWAGMTAEQIALAALDRGVRRMILLDLARVGGGRGVGTEPLCRRLRQRDPELEITVGGGVRDIDDLRRLDEIGCDAVLVASALHDGRLRPEEIAEYIR